MYLWTFKISRCCCQNKIIFSLGLFCLPKCNVKYLKISWRHCVTDTQSQSQPFYRSHVVLNYAELKLKIVEQHKMFLFQGAQQRSDASCNYKTSPLHRLWVKYVALSHFEIWPFAEIPPPSISENHIVSFSPNFMLKKACLKVQNLQYNFLDWKRAPHPFPKIHPF